MSLQHLASNPMHIWYKLGDDWDVFLKESLPKRLSAGSSKSYLRYIGLVYLELLS